MPLWSTYLHARRGACYRELRRIPLPRTCVHNVDVSPVTLLWFFLGRMILVGLALGAGLGAAYGLVVVPSIFFLTGVLGSEGPGTDAQVAGGAYFLMIFSTPFGAVLGALAGLTLGLLEGAVLGAATVLRHREGASGDPLRYRRAAQLACVAACVLAVAVFWGLVFWQYRDSASVRVAFTRDLPEALILVVGPLLVATGASWWAARRVAGRYAHETASGTPPRHHY